MNFHLPESITGLMFENDAQAVAAQTPAFVAPVTPEPVAATVIGSVDHTDDAYQRLAAKTDFMSSSTFVAVNNCLAPLMSIIPDEKIRFKAALAQAQAQSNITSEAILAVFEQMKTVLQGESDHFGQFIGNATAQQVDAAKAKAADISTQIQSLQAQVTQLTEDAFNAQQKIDAAKHRFDVALQARTAELAQEQAKYTSLLA